MADPNIELEEFARLVAQFNEELRTLGYVTDQTARAMALGSTKNAKQLEQAGEKAVDALADLAGSVLGAARAMNQGAKGAAAFNNSIDQATNGVIAAVTVLGLLVPIGRALKPLGGALSALGINVGKAASSAAVMTAGVAGAALAVKGFTDLMKAANEQADKLYKGYSDLARSGAAASDGMSGLFENAKQLGLSMNELDSLANVVGQNSKELAIFAGSVFQGRRRLAQMGEELEGNREEFLRLGLSMADVTDGMAGYLRLQTLIGQSQNQTVTQLAQGAKEYLFEVEELTKLTGMTRKEQEAAREAALSEQRFAAKLEMLRQQDRHEEAEELMKTNLMLMSRSKELAQGFRDATTGMVQTEAAQKANMSTQGEILRTAAQLSEGQIQAAEATGRIVKVTGETAKRLPTMGLIGTFDDVMINYGDSIKMAGESNRDFVAEAEEAAKEVRRQREGTDRPTADQARLRETQIRANEAVERFVAANGLPAATLAAQSFASAVANGTENLNRLFGVTGTEPKSAQQAAAQGKVADLERQVEDMRAKSQSNLLGRVTGIGQTAEERKLEQTLHAAEQELAGIKQAQEMYESGLRKAIGDAQAEANTQAYGVVGKLFQKDVELSLEQKRKIEDDFRKQWQNYSQSMRVPNAAAPGGYAAPADVLPAPAPMFGGGAGGAPATGAGYFDMVSQLESGGRNIPESGGKSSAHGVYQITKGTFEGLAKMTGSPLAGRTFEEMQKDVDLQRQAMELLTDSNVRQLAAAKVSTTDAAKYLAHFLGAGGAIRVLKASDNTSIDQAVGADAIASNPNVFKNIATVGDLKNWVRDKTKNEFADGGISTGPVTGYPATLHGTEAVVPLPDGASIPVSLSPRLEKTLDVFRSLTNMNVAHLTRGGITSGPSIAGEAGPEAVVPLPNGRAIPVTINLKDAAAMGTGAYGNNEYIGVNLGPLSTDLEALKQIAGQLGAYDAATETITDPATWKEILSTGMLMNYDIAGAKIGTKMFGPDIGLEIGTAVKEVMASGDTDVATALKEVKDQFREAMAQVVDAMKDKDSDTQQRMLETLQNIAAMQGRTADASQKMARLAAN